MKRTLQRGDFFKRIYGFVQREDAYTFALNNTFLFVTLGMVLLALLMWFGTAMTAYGALRSAATSAAFAGQAQVTQVDAGSGTGFTTSSNWALTGNYQNAESTLFQTQVTNMHLGTAFTNLACSTIANGNQITVTASGDYLPIFLQKVAERYPVITAMSVPMEVTVSEEYKIVG